MLLANNNGRVLGRAQNSPQLYSTNSYQSDSTFMGREGTPATMLEPYNPGRRAAEVYEKILGQKPLETLSASQNGHHMLGLVWEQQGMFEAAEAKHRQALELRENSLPSGHPDIHTSVNYVVSVLKRQHKYKEAEAMRSQYSKWERL